MGTSSAYVLGVRGHFSLTSGSSFPDKVRGITNEGGFYAEREGWHLPGFNTSSWETRSPSQGLTAPGVGFFSTTVALDIPYGIDAPINIVYSGLNTSGSNETAYRSQLYVNGWQFGRFVSNLGCEDLFTLSEFYKLTHASKSTNNLPGPGGRP